MNSTEQDNKEKTNRQKNPYHIFWIICIIGITTLISVVYINSCNANNHLTDTLNQHQKVLSTLQESFLNNTSRNLGQRYKDSLIQITKQTLSSHEFNTDSNWKRASKEDIIVPVTLNVQLEELSQTMKETPEKIQACGKWFFDSNTVTFLVSLIVALLIAIITSIQSKMEESLRENQKSFDKNKEDLRKVKEENQKTIDKYKDDLKNIKEENEKTSKNYEKQITNDSKSMDLYVQIYALHNTAITIRQFLTPYYLQQSKTELLPELIYQAQTSIDDINNSLKDEFVVKKDLSNMMYKTLNSAIQNLTLKESKVATETADASAAKKDSETIKLVNMLLTPLIETIKDIQKELCTRTN